MGGSVASCQDHPQQGHGAAQGARTRYPAADTGGGGVQPGAGRHGGWGVIGRAGGGACFLCLNGSVEKSRVFPEKAPGLCLSEFRGKIRMSRGLENSVAQNTKGGAVCAAASMLLTAFVHVAGGGGGENGGA